VALDAQTAVKVASTLVRAHKVPEKTENENPRDDLRRPALGRISEPGHQLWRSTLGGDFSVALAAQTAVKVASKLVRAQKVRERTENENPRDDLRRPALGRISEPGHQLWRSTLGGDFFVALAAQTAVKVASKLVRAQKVREKPENRKCARRLKEASVRSNGRTMVPAMTLPLKRWLLRGTGCLNFCKSRIEAGKKPRKCPNNRKAAPRDDLVEACVDRMSEPGSPLWRAILGRVF
jgi:hypothetical protein